LINNFIISSSSPARGDEPNPKQWKANFRCALNAHPEINSVQNLGCKRGKNAFRVFQFTRQRRSKGLGKN